jgi:hypothetical protein
MFKSIFQWLLNMSLTRAALILNTIQYVILGIVMAILNWYHKHH